MMRKLATFLLPLFLFSFLSIQAQIIFEDGFESGNLNNWSANGDTAVISNEPYEGSACFRGSNLYQIQNTFSPISDDLITVEFAMKAAQDDKECVDFLVYDEFDNPIARVYFSQIYIYTKNGVNDQVLITYTWDVWYRVKVVLDQVNREYIVLIDGDTIGQNLEFINLESSYASKFYFSGSETDGSVGYVDDVSVNVSNPEKDALIALYNATGGANWTDNTNWNTEVDLGDWYGVTTDGDGHVTEMDLEDNNLVGTIPAEIGDFPYLQNLSLRKNTISGSIPAEIENLSALQHLLLFQNQLSGNPFGEITNLTNLTTLVELELTMNAFSGAIPASIGNLNQLYDLKIGFNQFSGSIPTEIGDLVLLEVLLLRGTNLSGSIPSSIGNLANLHTLYLYGNNLSGSIPESFGGLLNLQYLFLYENQLSGSIPLSICSLPTLYYFDFYDNQLEIIPEEFQTFNGITVSAENNQFTFEDLENLPAVATYAPQDTISIYDTTYLQAGVEGLIQLSFDGSVNNSSYNWFSNDQFVSTTSGNSIIANLSNPGTFYYNLEITNPSFPEFTLFVDSVVVIVQENSNYSTNFDEYVVGDYLAVVDGGWDTWSGTTGGSEDALITSEYAQSPLNSVKVQGSTDVIYRMGNKTSGHHQLSMAMYVPTGNVGYFNVEHTDTPGQEFALDCDFKLSGIGELIVGDTIIVFDYINDEWNDIILIVDLDNDWATFKINGTEINQWQWSIMTNGSVGAVQLGCLDFFAKNTYGTPYFYFDNIVLSELEPVNCSNIGLAGTFNEWGATDDHLLTQDVNEPYKWTSSFTLNDFSEIKIRQNEAWDINWGAIDFPIGYGNQDGENIPVPAGSYLVHFYCESGYYNFESESERNALMALYNATNGDNWTDNTNWNSSEPIDTWYGVYTNEQGNVDTLYLGNNNLVGSIPYEVGELSELITLALSANTLTGDLPSTIGNLSNLQRISISQCQLSGSIPTEIGNLTNLTWLALWQNDFSGDIPAEFWGLTQLEYIWLGTNANLSGSLPSDIGSFTNLKKLWIDGTSLSGGIPSSIGFLEQLEVLKLGNNNMDSWLPSELSYLSKLKELDLSGNDFHGELYNFVSPDSLQIVLISGNRFDNIQPGWESLDLDTMNIQNNQMTFEDLLNLPANTVYDPQDTIVVEDATYLEAGITGLIELPFDGSVNNSFYDWYRNGEFASTTNGNSIMATESEAGTVYFSVEITNPAFPDFLLFADSIVVITEEPTVEKVALMALYEATDGDNWTDNTNWNSEAPLSEWFGVNTNGDGYVQEIYLNDNNLVGNLPAEIGDLSDCIGISFMNNQISGPIPPEIGNLSALNNLYLSNNQLESIPTEISGLTSLIDILLDNNALIGTFPVELCSINSIQRIFLWNNQLSGPLPSEIGNLTNMYYFYIDNNLFTGALPSEIGTLTSLQYLYFSNNQFSGTLPIEIGNLINISDLRFSSNQFEGEMPSSLANLSSLSTFYFSNNEFENFPSELSELSLNEGNGSNNNFTFEDIENFPANLNYDSQNIVDIIDTLFLSPNQPQMYELNFDQSVLNSSYQWVRDAVPIDVTDVGSLEIDENPDGQTHYYYLEISNSTYPGLYLQTDSLVVKTEGCHITHTTNVVDILCYNQDNGTIEIIAESGEEPYEYSNDAGETYQSSEWYNWLVPGVYYTKVKDSQGCESEVEEVFIFEPDELIVEYTEAPVSCFGMMDGSISLVVSGGIPDYTFDWTGPNDFTSSEHNIFGLEEGFYYLTVTDLNGCSSGNEIEIISPEAIVLDGLITHINCSGNNDGEIDVDISGGTPDYIVEWTGPNEFISTEAYLYGLEEGMYNLTVTDANNCEQTESYEVFEPLAMSVSETIISVTCFGNSDGSIDIMVSGGAPDYSFEWNGPNEFYASTEDITGLELGEYNLMIIDANYCQFNDVFIITEPDELDIVISITDVLCYGETTGEIDITVAGGTLPFEYSLDGESWQVDPLFTGLMAGDYEVVVRDVNNCEAIEMLTLGQPNSGIDFTENVTNILCAGESTGAIEILANGGTPDYQYSIDDGATFQSSNVFNSLVAGLYSVVIQDANTCTNQHEVTITEPENGVDFTENVTNILCAGESTGAIEILANGGTSDYQYSIDDGATFQSTNVFNSLAAGLYSVVIQDANTCTNQHEVTITEPENGVDFTENVTNILCAGESNGAIEIIANGGTPDYQYSIDDGVNFQSSNVFNSLAAGEYSIVIRDVNACTNSHLVIITGPDQGVEFTEIITDVACFGDLSGSIQLLATGGIEPYEYSMTGTGPWQFSSYFGGLVAGEYQMAVRDANLCVSTHVVIVSEPENALSLIVNSTDVQCFGGDDGEIELIANGGILSYEYSIDNGVSWQASSIFSNLIEGSYIVLVNDANGCAQSENVVISQPSALPEVIFTGLDAEYCEDVLEVILTGNQVPSGEFTGAGITDLGDGTAIFNPSIIGVGGPFEITYSYSDVLGCSNSETQSTFINEVTIIDFTGLDAEYCIDASVAVLVGSQAPEGTFSGLGISDNGNGTAIFNPLEAGEGGPFDIVYEYNSSSSCNSQITHQTIVNPLPTVYFTGLEDASCLGDDPLELIGNHAPDGDFSGPGLVDNGDGTATFDPDIVGLGGPYTLVYNYTDAGGCSNSYNQSTSVYNIPNVSFTGLDPNYCEGASEILITGNQAPDGAFSGPGVFDQNDGTAYFYPVVIGVGGPYQISYSYQNLNGCVGTETQVTNVVEIPVVSFTGLNPSYCVNDAIIVVTGNYSPDGVFSGPGIINNGDGTASFDPSTAGVGGAYEIKYEYTSPEGCYGEEIQEVDVFDIDILSFTGLDLSYCSKDETVVLTGNLMPDGSFSGAGITNNGDGTALFNPLEAGVGGPYDIMYFNTNGNGCYSEITESTTVNLSPETSFTGLGNSYCINEPAVVLIGNYSPEGSFSGLGIIDNGDGTATFDPIAVGVGGTYEIKYEYTSSEGCYGEEIQVVDLFGIAVLAFSGLDANYCSADAPIELTGNIAPIGTFSGSGITDNGDGTAEFNPLEAGVGGPYDILYFYTNGNSCYSETMESTTVNLTPELSFTGLGSTYCIDSESIVLTGDQITGSYSGAGIVDNGDGTAIFTPSDAGAGTFHEIVYSITSNEGCYAEDVQQVNVEDLQELSFDGLESDYCFSNPVSVLTGNMVPFGSFIGQGLTDNGDGTAIFDPQIAGIGGPYMITYKYQSGVCMNLYEQEVTVYNSTAVSFTGLDETYCNVNKEFVLTGSESPSGYFTGQGVEDNGDGTATINPAVFGVGGPYLVTYHFENENGCISYVEEFTSIIDGPIGLFDYSLGGCVEDAIFVDQSTSPNGDIIDWNWNFDDPESDGSNISDAQNPLHQFVSNQSAFNIKLVVGDELGCMDSIVQLIEPFSTSTITGHLYSSDGSDITDGYVLAYLLSDGFISTRVDSVQIAEDGSFICLDMATCVDYIFRAYANEMIYPDVMPRWYVDSYFWADATHVALNWEDELVDNIDINLFQVLAPPEGSSGIGGGVYYTGGKGEPVKNVDVVLEFDSPEEKGIEVVGYKPTDELGHWEFNKLGEGTFKISVDIPGLEIDSVYTVTISAPNTNIANLNYYIDPEHGIYIAPTGLDEFDDLGFGSIGVFPNPNSGQFYLEIIKAEHITRLNINAVQLWDMEGRLIKDLGVQFKGEHYLIHLNLSDIEPGMYFIRVKNKEEVGVVKFVIQR